MLFLDEGRFIFRKQVKGQNNACRCYENLDGVRDVYVTCRQSAGSARKIVGPLFFFRINEFLLLYEINSNTTIWEINWIFKKICAIHFNWKNCGGSFHREIINVSTLDLRRVDVCFRNMWVLLRGWRSEFEAVSRIKVIWTAGKKTDSKFPVDAGFVCDKSVVTSVRLEWRIILMLCV